ncbi:MAG: DUF3108 domain-containing protein [Pyrinomonadaceae bacterium]
MKCAIFRTIILTAILTGATLVHPGQTGGMQGQMFAGESLTYEGRVSKLKVSISVAELAFAAVAKPDSDELVLKTLAVSKGTLLKMFRYSFLQQYESTIDLANFRILKTTKHDVQKERIRDSEALFDYGEKRVRYVETDPTDRNRPPRRIASEISEPLYDMVSSIYYVRTQQLAVGKSFDLTVSDSGLVFKVPVVVTAREQQKSTLGNLWCFRVEPQIFGTNRLIEQRGKMVIWMTDDARRIPVRAQINTSFGKIDIKLKSVTKQS